MVVVGIDEAGRGCWAGPLVAAAVILDKPIVGLKDSKKTSKIQREQLAKEIYLHATGVGLGWASPAQIDTLGLTKATSLAMGMALQGINTDFECIIIDGNYNYLPDLINVETMVKADSRIAEVSAASIIAKTERDKYMIRMAKKYPLYGFDKHVGYGTSNHITSIRENGLCELHRRSFRPIKESLVLADA